MQYFHIAKRLCDKDFADKQILDFWLFELFSPLI